MTESGSAPEWIAYCPRCGGRLETRPVQDKPRRACPVCGYVHFTDPKVGVGVLVVEDGRLLLVRRAMDPAKGRWSVPAGYLDHGEDPRLTAERETLEETGLVVRVNRLIDVFHNPPDSGGASIFILFGAERISGDLRPGDDVDAAGYFSPDDLPELAFASTFAAVRALSGVS